MRPILEGIRILDLSIWMQGPSATAMLGDMGAEVIKVEPPDGDPSRGLVGVLRKTTDLPIAWDFYFEYFNRNKKSLALNLKDRRGKEAVLRLADECDVFVQNFRQGVIERLGLGYEELKARNSSIIYASATGYGPQGPDSAKPSFDYMGQARSGFLKAISLPGAQPYRPAGGMADQMGAIMLAYGIMGALIARERQGEGQKVEISHLGSMMHLQALNIQSTLTMGRPLPQLPRTHAGNPLWNHYRCQDDKWICLGMIEPHRYWHDFCSALGIAHLEHDPRFFHTAARSRNREEFIGILDERFAARTRDEWMQLLDREGDFIYTVMNDFPDVVEDPHAILNSYVTEYEHPKHGTIKVSGFPVTFSGSPCAVQSHAPGPGEHSREILSNLARFTPEEIDAMSNDNVIKSPAAKSVEEERHGHR